MKQKKESRHIRAFLSGAVTTLLVCACLTTALAASGSVSFNKVRVSFNMQTVLPKGQDLSTESGASIPSTILYTDEQGNGTTYVPIRVLAETLHMPMWWDGTSGALNVEVSGDQALYMLGLDDAGLEWSGLAEEVEPIVPQAGKTLAEEIYSQQRDAFQKEFSLTEEDGEYLSITVTNNGHYPLQLDLGLSTDGEFIYTSTQVPVGSTVTRTMKCISFEGLENQPLTVRVGNATGTSHVIDAEITAVQFNAE